ncbi:hypothetical protein N9Y92_01715 [Chlamydiales bacterium]|nr:hypothetical protein [Chlamydiales bacterium]
MSFLARIHAFFTHHEGMVKAHKSAIDGTDDLNVKIQKLKTKISDFEAEKDLHPNDYKRLQKDLQNLKFIQFKKLNSNPSNIKKLHSILMESHDKEMKSVFIDKILAESNGKTPFQEYLDSNEFTIVELDFIISEIPENKRRDFSNKYALIEKIEKKEIKPIGRSRLQAEAILRYLNSLN